MEEQTEHPQMEPGEEEKKPSRLSGIRRSLGRAFGFLRAPSFWGGLVVGVVVLGVGIAIGLGVAERRDDDRGWEGDRDGRWTAKFRIDDDREGFHEWGSKGEHWKNGLGKGRLGRGMMERGGLPARGGTVPDEVWERVESLLEEIEYLVKRAADHRFGGGFGDGFPGGFFFGPARFGDGGAWQFEEGFWSDSRRPEFGDEHPEDPGWWDETDGGGQLGSFGFGLGEMLPWLGMLEVCDLDPEMLPEMFEGFADIDGSDGAGLDEMDGFLEQIEEMLEAICEESTGG